MKLEVGQFVRLKSGYICKIININDFREPNMKYGVEANYLKDVMFIGDDDVVKASYNIIDILEEGDYVNSKEVIEIYQSGTKFKGSSMYSFREKTIELANDNYETIPHDCLLINEDIKTIITKEQFEQMSYKIKENK